MRLLSAIVFSSALLVRASLAFAQVPDPQDPPAPVRPYGGVFAQTRGASEQTLTFLGTLSGGYDTNVLAGSLGGPAGSGLPGLIGPAQPSSFEDGSGMLSYSLKGHRISLDVTGGSAANYYPALHSNQFAATESTSTSLGWHASARTEVTATFSATYGPYYGLPGTAEVATVPTGTATDPGQQVLGQTLPLDSGSALLVEDHLIATGGVTLTHNLTRRLSFNVNYDDSVVTSPSHALDLTQLTYGGGFSYKLARGLTGRLSYTESKGTFGSGSANQFDSQGLSGGIDLAVSISRRTFLAWSMGVGAYSNVLFHGDRPQYFVNGQVSVAREIGRTWSATAGYSRAGSFLEVFRQPVFSDTVSAGLGGRISHLIQLQSSAGFTNGQVGLGSSPSNLLRTWFVSGGLRLDANRDVSVGFDYTYYHYLVGSAVELPFDLAGQSGRQSARAYLSLWAPLMSRGREPNAAR